MHTLGVWVSKCGRYPVAASSLSSCVNSCAGTVQGWSLSVSKSGLGQQSHLNIPLPGHLDFGLFERGKNSLEPVCSFKQFLMLSDGCCFHPRIQFCFVLNSGYWVSCRPWCRNC